MELYNCSPSRIINYSGLPSSPLFVSGILSNTIALVILWKNIFYLLVTGLTIVNMMGKVMVCPVVLDAYSKNQTVQLASSQTLCQYFAFCMTFFGLAPTIILLAMALVCWLSLARPFLYYTDITNKVGFLVPMMSCIFSFGFCSLPLFDIGNFVQYRPGSWCFLQRTVKNSKASHFAYSVVYGTGIGLLVIATAIFNMDIMRHLYKINIE